MLEKEKSRTGRLKRTITAIAPQLAHALGGPLAGAAVSAISRALFGKEVVDEETITAALEQANPEQIIALRKADQEFKLALKHASIEELKIDATDRASARDRQSMMDDWTPSVLGALIIAGFFIVLAAMIARKLPVGTETEFSIMLGALATMTAAVVNYFFGSSVGSREKTRMLTTPVNGLDRAQGKGTEPSEQ